MRCLAAPLLLLVFAFNITEQPKPIFEKKEIRSVKYAVAVLPGAFPKSYGYFNKAFKFNNIDPLTLHFTSTDSAQLVLVQKILKEQLGAYLDSKKITVPNVTSNKVHDALNKYGQQVMTLTDKAGKNYICMNAVCEPEKFSDRWLNNWVEVKDGGTCYWHLIISLSDKKLLFAHPNGDA